MKVVWLCNMMLSAISGSGGGGLWVDHVLSDLRRQSEIRMRVFCQGPNPGSGKLDEKTDYVVFPIALPYRYRNELEAEFRQNLEEFQPDVIHIWGTEYAHTLAMVNAAHSVGMGNRVVISIQGLCGPYARHYTEGIPDSVRWGFTFRELIRWDNIALQQRKFVRRGVLERQALEKTGHVIGRTAWDRACTRVLTPGAEYHFCNETLREPFYQGQWRYASCKKHRIFASSCLYPLKGFHYLLEALPIVRRDYPDVEVAVVGDNFLAPSFSDRIREESYTRYLKKLSRGQERCLHFLGRLSAEQMKQAYLQANVFVLPSTVENSPNSLGEAMLLGVPCVAADVGGVTTMLHQGEGIVYPSASPDLLAHSILEVFAMEGRAEQMGTAARAHALVTHDPETNLEALLAIYRQVGETRS